LARSNDPFCDKDSWGEERKSPMEKAHGQRRSFYSKDTYDLDYKFPFGWKELWGIAYRTDYDLKQHAKYSGQILEYTDPYTGKRFVPHVIEPAVGVNRLFLISLLDAYTEDGDRVVLKLNPKIAPYKVAVFPLLANKPELAAKSPRNLSNFEERLRCNLGR